MLGVWPTRLSSLYRLACLYTRNQASPAGLSSVAQVHTSVSCPKAKDLGWLLKDVKKEKREEGTTGELLYPTAAMNMQEMMPSLETHQQSFFGIPFTQIPICHIKATKNNTIIHVTDHRGGTLVMTSCGREGYKNAKKKSTIAGQTTGVAAAQRMLRRNIATVRIRVRGLGPGRMSSVRGMALSGINVVSITDDTRLIEKGPKQKKIRRI